MGSHFGNEGRDVPSLVKEIHVLLVDHDTDSLINTAKMLEMCSYRVTVVELASAAVSMLSRGKTKFDIVLADVNSPDFEGFKLLYHAVNMDLPLIFMSADDNTYLAMRALENGAFLFVKKPAAMEILRCLWQHVYRETEGSRSGTEDKNPSYALGGKGKAREKLKGQRGYNEEWYHRDDRSLVISDNGNRGVKRKICTEWTEDLHAKFVDAVTQLGEGRCFPKEILEIMGIPGLTRMQVASHLQKCRNNNWQAPEERRSSHMFRDIHSSPYRPRKFGSMPQLGCTRMSPRSIMTHAASNTNQASLQFEPGPSNTSRGKIHDFFISQDPARNVSSAPQGSRESNQTSSPAPSPCPRENSAVDSSKGQRSSETSNVESDDQTQHN